MRWFVVLVGLTVFLAAGTLGGAPVKGRSVHQEQLVEPNRSRTYSDTFKGGERACVIVVGNGRTALGLYIYDADGNCVARDDEGNSNTKDDLAVEWYPARTSRYTIEVRNFGSRGNVFQMAVR